MFIEFIKVLTKQILCGMVAIAMPGGVTDTSSTRYEVRQRNKYRNRFTAFKITLNKKKWTTRKQNVLQDILFYSLANQLGLTRRQSL